MPKCQLPDCTKDVMIDYRGDLSIGCHRNHAEQVTNLSKYGVPHHMQIPEIAEKVVKYGKLYRDYMWKCGNISMV